MTLFYAVQQSNNESEVRALIDAGADVNTCDEYGMTALFYAVQQINNESIIRALTDAGANVRKADVHGKTALFYAVHKSNNESVVRALIDAGADVNKTDEYRKTALLHAVQQSNNEIVVRALIDAGVDVNKSDNYGMTALLYAVQQSNNESVVRALIDAGANVSMSDKDGRTALFSAVQQSNNERAVRVLIESGADVNMAAKDGKTALFHSVKQSNNESVIRLLIEYGANVNKTGKDGKTALVYAVKQSNNESVVRALIDAGADVNMTDKGGITPLFYAFSASNNESVVHALIDAGADINMTDKDGATALGYAVVVPGNKSAVVALTNAGTDVNLPDKYGRTAMFYAVFVSNNESVVRVMIDAGADVNRTDKDGKTTLTHAVQKNNNESVVRALIQADADVNKTDKEGKTALIYAVCVSNNESVVRALIDADADVNKTDKEGKTALIYAVCVSNNESVVRVLIEAGAGVNITDKYGKTALLHAVQQNNENVSRELIAAGADVNKADENGKGALFYAVQQSINESTVRALIDAGADVNKTDEFGKTALFYVAQQSNENKVRALIDAGADMNMTDKNGKTALLHAVQQCAKSAICLLLIAGGTDVTIRDEYGKSSVFYAVQQNDENLVRALIDSARLKDIYGRTAHFYVDLKYPSSLSCLLEAGGNQYLSKLKDNCNVDIVSFLLNNWLSDLLLPFDIFKDKIQSLQKQYLRQIITILEVLEKHGIKQEHFAKAIVNVLFLESIRLHKTKYSKIYGFSSQSGFNLKVKVLEELYSRYIGDKSLQGKVKLESISRAFKNGCPNISEALELLVDLDADPDIADSDGNTVLHHVSRLALLGVPQETVMDICNQLQTFGVQFNKKNHQRQTALLFCLSADMHEVKDEALLPAVKTLVQVCMFLVKQGSSMDETSKRGESVFYLIIMFFERCFQIKDEVVRKDVLQEALKLLQLFPSWKVAKEKTINKADLHQYSPLHLWAFISLPSPQDYTKSLSEKILKYLLKCEARVNARNENDETPLHLCKTWTAVKLLIRDGANPKHLDSTGSSPLLVAAKDKTFHVNPNHFYPDVTEEPKLFWKTAVQMGLDPWTVNQNNESVLSILVKADSLVLSKALVDVACEEGPKSKKVALHLLNAICKDRSTRSHWKTVLVQDILKSREWSPTTLSTPLLYCCTNMIETGVFDRDKSSIQNKEFDIEKSADETRLAEGEKGGKSQTCYAAYDSLHCEIANFLRSYGADIQSPDLSGKSCLDLAEGHPTLKDFLTKPLDKDAVPILIPWTSTSANYENKMAKVARRQECVGVNQFWFHREPIGNGCCGEAFAAINGKDGREVAIKRVHKSRMSRAEDRREIKNLTALADCEQVVRYLSFFEDMHFSYIVLELMEGNLEEYLKGSTTDAAQATLLCKDVVMGLTFLHKQKILHCDLKPQNILYKVHPKLCLKIADFGLSRITDSVSTTKYLTVAGTRCWIAPEVLTSKANKVDKNRFKPASDMFCCGIILHYILSGRKHPFNPIDHATKGVLQVEHETEGNIMNGKMEGWDDSLSPEAIHLVKKMLDSNEGNRPSAEEALEHPFFWPNEKKMYFLEAVGNQTEFECPRSKRTPPLTPVETDLQVNSSTIVRHGKWDDPGYLHMPNIYAEMIAGKGRKNYDTSSAVELVRFIRNVYVHYREKSFVTPVPIEQMLFDDFLFLEYFPDLVMEVYKAVTTHGWDKTRDDIKYTMNKK